MTGAYQLMVQGGWFMLPIALASVVGLALFLERVWYLRRSRIVPFSLVDQLRGLLRDGDFEAAHRVCQENDAPVAKVVGSGLPYRGRSRRLLTDVMEESGIREMYFMRRFTSALGAIATVAPLMGLLGTVVGMIQMFQGVVISAEASGGGANVSHMASGIWEALLTTAGGLLVAIPVFLGYRYILSKIEQYGVEIEEVARGAIEALAGPEDAPLPSPAEVEPAQTGAA